MESIESIADMRQIRSKISGTIGFVPTMGYLHEGHLELVCRARAENDVTVVSIFVNPAQFGPGEDFEKYPRDPERDLALLEEIGVDYVFTPSPLEMYPSGFDTWIEVHQVTRPLEGAARPGHFRGVATIVAKLFNIVQPTRAYFGQKDSQQCIVIRKMTADLNMPVEIIIVPIVRESDGLAMSSRNVYLSREQRSQAPVIYRSLQLARQLWIEGEKNAAEIKRNMTAMIQEQPLANIEYISIADTDTLEELETVRPPALLSMVVKFGRTRLLDNIILQ